MDPYSAAASGSSEGLDHSADIVCTEQDDAAAVVGDELIASRSEATAIGGDNHDKTTILSTEETALSPNESLVSAAATVSSAVDNRPVALDSLDAMNDTVATTPRLLDKFDNLTSDWTFSASAETPKLMNKLGDLQRQWSMDSESTGGGKQRDRVANRVAAATTTNHGMRQYPASPGGASSLSADDSSTGRSTLSSYESCLAHVSKADAQQATFERLYRNARPYVAPPRHPDESSAMSVCSNVTGTNSLEKRLSYVAPGEVRRVRQQQRLEAARLLALTGGTASASATPTPKKPDTVFERLYRKEPRPPGSLLATPKKFQTTPRTVSQTQPQQTQPPLPPFSSSASVYERSPQRQKERKPIGASAAASVMSPGKRVAAKSTRVTDAKAFNFSPDSSRKKGGAVAQTPSSVASVASASSSVAAADSVFERLYRREPRPSMLVSSLKSANSSTMGSTAPRKQPVPSDNDIAIPSTPPRKVGGKAMLSARESPTTSVKAATRRAMQSITVPTKLPSPNPLANKPAASSSNKKSAVHAPVPLREGEVDVDCSRTTNVPNEQMVSAESKLDSSVLSDESQPSLPSPSASILPQPSCLDDQQSIDEYPSQHSSTIPVDSRHESDQVGVPSPVAGQANSSLEHHFALLSSNHELHSSATAIQSFWRMFYWTRRLRVYLSAVMLLQAIWRQHAQQCRNLEAFSTEQTVESNVETGASHEAVESGHVMTDAFIVDKEWSDRYARLLHRVSASRVQKLWRSTRVHRQRLLGTSTSVVPIQSLYRGHRCRYFLKLQRTAATKIGRAYRKHAVRHSDRMVKDATLLDSLCAARIQSSWRWQRRRALYRRHFAATRIQSCWRLFRVKCAMAHYKEEEECESAAAFVIQYAWRLLSAKAQLRRYLRALVTIQGFWRRKLVNRRHQDATKLQSTWRRCVAQRLVQRLKLEANQVAAAASAIQSIWRSRSAQVELNRCRTAAVKLQRFGRRHTLVRRHLLATRLQSNWRRCLVQRNVTRLAHQATSATSIQAMWRAHSARTELHRCHTAAVKIQRFGRCHTLLRRHLLATRLQSNWRRCLVQRDVTRLAHQTTSATSIQAMWRVRSARTELHRYQAAVVKIQGIVRRNALRRRHLLATRLQSSWRRCLAHRYATRLAHRITSATSLQAMWRARSARTELHRCQAAVVKIQRFGRRSALLRRHLLATRLQSNWRRCVVQRSAAHKAESATAIQSLWRKYSARTELHRCQAAAVRVQYAWRRKTLHWRNSSATRLQSTWRRCLLQRNVTLQRHEARRTAASLAIQAVCRSRRARKEFHRSLVALVKIQCAWRRHLLAEKLQRNWRLRRTAAAVAIESTWRACRATVELQRSKGAARLIQRFWRRKIIARRRYLDAKLQRQEENRGSAALFIQSIWRSFTARAELRRILDALITIQGFWRRTFAQLLLERSRLSGGTVAADSFRDNNGYSEEFRVYDFNVASTDTYNAAMTIKKGCARWKLELALRSLESAVYLLHRSLYGSFSRSITLYALLQSNTVVRSVRVSTYNKIVNRRSLSVRIWQKKWDEQTLKAISMAAVLLQSFVRGCLCRKSLTGRESLVKPMFTMKVFERRDELETRCVPIPTASLARQPDERRLLHSIACKSTILAESYVGHLLGTTQNELLVGSAESPCLLRLAARTREAQRRRIRGTAFADDTSQTH